MLLLHILSLTFAISLKIGLTTADISKKLPISIFDLYSPPTKSLITASPSSIEYRTELPNQYQYLINEEDLMYMRPPPPPPTSSSLLKQNQYDFINYYQKKPNKYDSKKFLSNVKHINYNNQKQIITGDMVQPSPSPSSSPVFTQHQTSQYNKNNENNHFDLNKNVDNINVGQETKYNVQEKKIFPIDSKNRDSKIIKSNYNNSQKNIPKNRHTTVVAGESTTLVEEPFLSNDGNERIEYQVHGFNGPNSYKFGYDTGKGKNRQFRVEHRKDNGDVAGQYGYYDKNGKMHLVKYTSTANEGFRIQT